MKIDLIWQHTEKINIIEIKASETIMPDMFKGLNYFEALKPDLINSKTLIHTGDFNQNRTDAEVRSWRVIKINVGT